MFAGSPIARLVPRSSHDFRYLQSRIRRGRVITRNLEGVSLSFISRQRAEALAIAASQMGMNLESAGFIAGDYSQAI